MAIYGMGSKTIDEGQQNQRKGKGEQGFEVELETGWRGNKGGKNGRPSVDLETEMKGATPSLQSVGSSGCGQGKCIVVCPRELTTNISCLMVLIPK
jgi:hypothetical protein